MRRLPVVDAGRLAGIVTIDDIAVRSGNLGTVRRMTAEAGAGAPPRLYSRERG